MNCASSGGRNGFTIIETMLFLAISGFLFVGILAGTGSSIANQRYNDSVEGVTNELRNQYSFAMDTQVVTRDKSDGTCYGLIRSDIQGGDVAAYFNSVTTPSLIAGRGRTNCVVYGAVISLNGSKIQSTSLIGRDFATLVTQAKQNNEVISESDTKDDISILNYVGANNLSIHCSSNTSNGSANATYHIRTAGELRSTTLKWGAKMINPVTKTDLKKTILIFRSPRDGAIRTFVMDGVIMDTSTNKEVDYTDINNKNNGLGTNYGQGYTLDASGVHQYLSTGKFTESDVKICVDSNEAQAYGGHHRMIKILKSGHSSSAVELLDMDNDEGAECDEKE